LNKNVFFILELKHSLAVFLGFDKKMYINKYKKYILCLAAHGDLFKSVNRNINSWSMMPCDNWI